jgi:uncharacterized CHY-type Zn-finger protein
MEIIKQKNNISVKGKTIDNQTRCGHYHSDLDVIAIKFKCCENYYPCYFCHEETENHQVEIWKKEEFETLAILCGVCKHEMTINEYLNCHNICPFCQTFFNPKCENHYHFYFESVV